MMNRIKKLSILAVSLAAIGLAASASAKPLKVYILAGQSNMQGHASYRTFGYLGDDPKTAPLLKIMQDKDGQPVVADRVWISYLTGSKASGQNGVATGQLNATFGARRNPQQSDGKIGPEYTFGLTMQQHYDGPILLIKAAWGGTTLHTDWRPPSNDQNKPAGTYYQLTIDHVKQVLADLRKAVPDDDPGDGYELAGFVWFQGFNDMVDGKTYPNNKEPGGYDLYSQLMAQFIRDVRKDLAAPELPFVIGVMGIGGENDKPNYFRQAMAAPAALPEFQGNVVAVETAPFWDENLAALVSEKEAIKKAGYYIRKHNKYPDKNELRHVVKNPIAAEIIKKYQSEDGLFTKKKINAFLEEYAQKRLGPEKLTILERGVSNAGYHYLGAAKILGPIGEAFAEAVLALEKK